MTTLIEELRAYVETCKRRAQGHREELLEEDYNDWDCAADELSVILSRATSGEVSDRDVHLAARAICKEQADSCGTHMEDEWTLYSDEWISYARAALQSLITAHKART